MKRHFLWIGELFVWVLVLFLVSGGIMLAKYNYKRIFNTYQIFLPDVDGLINGSPVKMMGINIGYVNQINIVGDDVYVKFIITESDVKIPPGSKVTVEFSGLGGSKSLEIYPPNADVQTPGKLLIVQSPKRIHDSLGLLNDMYDKIIDITYEVSNFMDQIGVIKSENESKKLGTSKSAGEFLDFSNTWLEKAQKQCDKFGCKINGKAKNSEKGRKTEEGKSDEQGKNKSN